LDATVDPTDFVLQFSLD